MGLKIDETDNSILSELVENSKLSSKILAKKLKIHPNTLLQRVKRLEKNGIIKQYTTVVDYGKLGYGIHALIFLKVNMARGWEDSLRPLSKLPNILSFLLITGDADALVIAHVKDKDELAALMRKLQDNNVVNKTTTHLIVDSYKEPHEFNPLKER